MKNSALKIANITVQPGERITIALPTPELYTCIPMYIPVHIIHGKKAGPILLICGAMHGDEINGVVIIQRLLNLKSLKSIHGTLILVPSMNIYGMINLSRDLPDRRDLGGSFPGSESGSYASRLAHLLTTEIFDKTTHCIDLHTGEPHISKFPQVKTHLNNDEAQQLAYHFQAPVMLDTKSQYGLLWLLENKKIPTIIYECGEALRLDEYGIKLGVKGITRAMKYLNMLSGTLKGSKDPEPTQSQDEYWLRAPCSGLCETFVKIGRLVKKGDRLAKISDPFGTQQKQEILSPTNGFIIAKNNLPILNEGEPLLQIAEIQKAAEEKIESWADEEKTGVSFE